MRKLCLVLLLLLGITLIAALAPGATAATLPPRAAVAKGPAPPVGLPKVVAALPGARYPWVQPMWVKVGVVALPRLPVLILTGGAVQPPAWISIG
jgi:hypothetical protein